MPKKHGGDMSAVDGMQMTAQVSISLRRIQIEPLVCILEIANQSGGQGHGLELIFVNSVLLMFCYVIDTSAIGVAGLTITSYLLFHIFTLLD